MRQSLSWCGLQDFIAEAKTMRRIRCSGARQRGKEIRPETCQNETFLHPRTQLIDVSCRKVQTTLTFCLTGMTNHLWAWPIFIRLLANSQLSIWSSEFQSLLWWSPLFHGKYTSSFFYPRFRSTWDSNPQYIFPYTKYLLLISIALIKCVQTDGLRGLRRERTNRELLVRVYAEKSQRVALNSRPRA